MSELAAVKAERDSLRQQVGDLQSQDQQKVSVVRACVCVCGVGAAQVTLCLIYLQSSHTSLQERSFREIAKEVSVFEVNCLYDTRAHLLNHKCTYVRTYMCMQCRLCSIVM